jgi:hypothetical protein
MVKIYLFVALSFWLVATQNLDQKLCEPFAPRLSLGYYYATGGDDYIELAFNTNVLILYDNSLHAQMRSSTFGLGLTLSKRSSWILHSCST